MNKQLGVYGEAVQGPQNLLVVDVAQCGAGCTPQLRVVEVASFAGSSVTEAVPADYDVRRAQCSARRLARLFPILTRISVRAELRVRSARQVQLQDGLVSLLRGLYGLQVPRDDCAGVES